MTYKIAAFYRFVEIADIPTHRAEIYAFAEDCEGMCGTILLAPEGINATIGAKPDALDAMIKFLDERFGISMGELKYSASEEKPFNKFKVRPKKEIITMRAAEEANPNVRVGKYVSPKEWNALMADPEVITLDTRNDYETKVGIFEGAVDPDIKNFTDFKDYVAEHLDPAKHKKVAMYCTGGIRCEKASAYMLSKGFEEVYHLKGGILQYLEDVPEAESRWNGECFVFDKRVSVRHGLEVGDWDICHGCREPLSEEDCASEAYEKGVSCPHCADTLDEARIKVLRQRQAQYEARMAG